MMNIQDISRILNHECILWKADGFAIFSECQHKYDPFAKACEGQCPPDSVEPHGSAAKHIGERNSGAGENNADQAAESCIAKA